MKNLKTIIGLASLMSLSALAQTNPNRLSLGFVGNLASSQYPEATNAERNFEADDDFSLGISADVSTDVGTGIALETGASLLNRQVTWGSDEVNFSQSYWLVRIPVTAQLNVTKMLSFGAGTYLATPVSSISNELNFGATDLDFNTDTDPDLELGALVSARVNMPMQGNASLFIEAQYLRGLTDLANADDVVSYTNDVSSKIGISMIL